MATIRDIAANAKVSIATVSRVLNDSGYADSETRVQLTWQHNGRAERPTIVAGEHMVKELWEG